MDSQQGFLPEYRNILNKSKKRFLRKPNVSEASEQFQQLGKRLEDNQEPQYAAYCHLAQGRCEQTIGNNPGEVEAITKAGRAFLKHEMNTHYLKIPSMDFQLTAADQCFCKAAKLHEEQGREQLAAGLYLELAEAYRSMKRPLEALHYYQKAVTLSREHPVEIIQAKLKVASCYITTKDHHNALLVLSDIVNIAKEHDHGQLNIYQDVQGNVEILRVLLLLIIEPSSHNTSPHMLSVLDKYRVTEDTLDFESKVSPYLSDEVCILLQSLVIAVDSLQVDSVLYCEDQLEPLLTDEQNSLLRILVKQTQRKV